MIKNAGPAVVDLLIRHGTDINAWNAAGLNALRLAAAIVIQQAKDLGGVQIYWPLADVFAVHPTS